MDLFLIEKLAVLRLKQRLVRGNPPLFRVERRAAVALEPGEWSAIGGWFRRQVKPSARLLRVAIVLQVPAAILLLALEVRVGWFGRAMDRLGMTFSIAPTLLFACFLMPIGAFLLHNRAVLRTTGEIVDRLADRPRVAVEDGRANRVTRLLQIGVLLWFGPSVLIDLYGSAFPDAFRNTPWVGRHADGWTWIGLVAILSLVAIDGWRFAFARRRAAA